MTAQFLILMLVRFSIPKTCRETFGHRRSQNDHGCDRILMLMLDRLTSWLRSNSVNACFCTLAIHPPYRRRARLLCGDAPTVPWIVLTDEPDEFADLPVHAIRHIPTGPMATDFLTKLPPTGSGSGRPAYHDKRFALRAALEQFDTAIFVDADSRIRSLRLPSTYHRGITVIPESKNSIADHLKMWGQFRRPAFEELAQHLNLDLRSARWCAEFLFAITKDGQESEFFETRAVAADFLHQRNVWTGEGGVIGLAAEYVGWKVNDKGLARLAASIQHEGYGPKST